MERPPTGRRLATATTSGIVSRRSPGEAGRAADADVDPPVSTPARPVLLVDDNRDLAEALAMLLDSVGIRVEVAHDGPVALAALERVTEPVDIRVLVELLNSLD